MGFDKAIKFDHFMSYRFGYRNAAEHPPVAGPAHQGSARAKLRPEQVRLWDCLKKGEVGLWTHEQNALRIP